MGLKELQVLEQQINDRLLSVRERKVDSLELYFHAFSFSLSSKSLSYWTEWQSSDLVYEFLNANSTISGGVANGATRKSETTGNSFSKGNPSNLMISF